MIPDYGYVSSVTHHDGLFWMYSEYPVKGQNSPWEHLLDGTTVTPDYGPVSLATAIAPEGPWTVRTMVLTPGTGWESGGTMSGSVFQIDGRWQMLYAATKPPVSGLRFDTHDMIGYAYSVDGVQFSRSTRNPIISDTVISLGNVSTYVEDGKVYLFYTHRVNVPQWTESLGEIVLNDLPPK